MKPIVGIPLGDPAGVGPEIIVKALAKAEVYEMARPLVIGDAKVLKQAMKFCGLELELHTVEKPSEGKFVPGIIDVIDLENVKIEELQIGKVQAMGESSFSVY